MLFCALHVVHQKYYYSTHTHRTHTQTLQFFWLPHFLCLASIMSEEEEEEGPRKKKKKKERTEKTNAKRKSGKPVVARSNRTPFVRLSSCLESTRSPSSSSLSRSLFLGVKIHCTTTGKEVSIWLQIELKCACRNGFTVVVSKVGFLRRRKGKDRKGYERVWTSDKDEDTKSRNFDDIVVFRGNFFLKGKSEKRTNDRVSRRRERKTLGPRERRKNEMNEKKKAKDEKKGVRERLVDRLFPIHGMANQYAGGAWR